MGIEHSSPLSSRSAGILCHITSLPSVFGIGDLGPESFAFADFLNRSKQKYWQLLPLNPVSESQHYSPYSASSSMAGNTLLISPELLEDEGLLRPDDLLNAQLPSKSKINFSKVVAAKIPLFDKAYRKFKNQKTASSQKAFEDFCEKENYWLHDFALYSLLKERFNAPWYDWPELYKQRDKDTLKSLTSDHQEKLNYIKWLQFVFQEQWINLKSYCNDSGVKMFGDLPFYVSYDSADVWSHREIFSIDVKGKMIGVAGVPPDYFNSDGQLWGMPVFNWKTLKDKNYQWWGNRIARNLELFDVVRLDHFRAFAGFWEVPSRESTAKNGEWKKGPGEDFFDAMLSKFKTLPFVAEDLGDIDEPVYKLRDKYSLPGMKILQFAFGDNMPQSDYIPHNYSSNFVVYTGTHDNNTTIGWYEQDAGKTELKNLKRYFGKKVSKRNIHKHLIKLAYSSVANTVIIPLQDILGLDASGRMNTPASVEDNWLWRMKPSDLSERQQTKLLSLVETYNRDTAKQKSL